MTENDMTWRGTYIVLLIIFFLAPLSMAVSEDNNGIPNMTSNVTFDVSSNVASNITNVSEDTGNTIVVEDDIQEPTTEKKSSPGFEYMMSFISFLSAVFIIKKMI